MSDGEPEWLPLAEAFERFADTEARKEYESANAAYVETNKLGHGLPRYWDNIRAWRNAEPARRRVGHAVSEARARVDRARARLHSSFFGRLSAGELICRAREGSPLGPWCDSPADAWTALRVKSWSAGMLTVLGTGDRLFSAIVAAGPTLKAGPAKPDARPVAGPHTCSMADPSHARRAFSMAEVERWYTREWVPRRSAHGLPPSRDEDLEAAREIFPAVNRAFLRRLRQEHAPAEWQRRGRPKTSKRSTPKSGS